MIRVTFVTTSLGIGGAETMLCKLLKAMDRGRFAPSVVCLRRGGALADRIERLGIPLASVDMSAGRVSAGDVRRLTATTRAQRPHLIQSWMYHANILGSVAARRLGAPIVWSIRHGQPSLRGTGPSTFAVLLAGAAMSRWLPSQVIYCGMTAARQHHRLGYTPSRSTVIPNGFDVHRFRPRDGARAGLLSELRVGPDSILIGHVARYHRQKDHATLLRAAAIAARGNSRLRWVLCGPGVDSDNSELNSALSRNGLLDRVFLLGTRRDVDVLHAAFDIGTISSSAEGFPNTVGESMACGTPCVVTDAGDARAMVGETGLVTPVRRPASLAGAWLSMASQSATKRRELGLAARARIVRRFAMPAVARRYESVYARIVRPGA